jgi:hypothetical protein
MGMVSGWNAEESQRKGGPTLEWGLYACPVTSKPKRCRKNMTLSFRSCESRIGSAVALRKRVLSWSSTQTSKTVASIEVHELIMAPIHLLDFTFRKIFIFLVVCPHLHFPWSSSTWEHRKYIWGSEGKSVAALIEDGVEINLIKTVSVRNFERVVIKYRICFPSLESQV